MLKAAQSTKKNIGEKELGPVEKKLKTLIGKK